MVDIISFDKLVGEEYQESVKLKDGKIPLLEAKSEGSTQRFVEALGNTLLVADADLHAKYVTLPQYWQFVLEELEALVTIGAIAAKSHTEETRLYDLGCGIAIPSMVYSMLTGEPVTAIDINKNVLNNAEALATSVDAIVDFQESRVKDYMDNVKLKPEDIIIGANNTGDMAVYKEDLTSKHKLTSITSGVIGIAGINFFEEDLIQKGYNCQFATYDSYFKFKISIDRLSKPDKSFIILATPKA